MLMCAIFDMMTHDNLRTQDESISLDSNAEDVTETIITVFDLEGNFYLDPPFQSVGNAKFEGLEFI